MVKVVLKSSSNPNYYNLVGVRGTLEFGNDGKFYFRFIDRYRNYRVMVSFVSRVLGDLYHPCCREIHIVTVRGSSYLFEKLENVGERLYDGF